MWSEDDEIDVYAEARASGAADMRERAAKLAEATVTEPGYWGGMNLAKRIRSLPLDPDQEGE